MKRFSVWLEDNAQGQNTGVSTGFGNANGMNTTQSYIPPQGMRSTVDIQGDKTISGNNSPQKSIDPEISTAANNLQNIHGQLRNIFAQIRKKSDSWRDTHMKGAFERELVAGVDGVGRAHAILLPTAMGIDR